MRIDLTEERVEGLGVVTGCVQWYNGFNGSLEEPPEPAEILEIDLVNDKGQEINSEDIFENEVLYKALEEKVLEILTAWNNIEHWCSDESSSDKSE